MSRDIRMKITVRNNLLLEAIEGAGYRSVATFCKASEIGYPAMCSLVGMKTSPLIWAKSADGTEFSQWHPLVIQVALALEMDEADLFSQLILEAKPLKKNTRRMYCNSETSQMWMAGRSGQNQLPADEAVFSRELKDDFESLLKTLSPKEETVLRARYGLDGDEKSLEELGRMFNVTRERIRQIETKALRKMRHPTRAKKLRQFLPLNSKHYDEEMPT